MKRAKLRNLRPKAPLGALISAGLGLTGSIINAIGASRQAKSDADAIEAQTRAQADMITKLNENNNKLQQDLIASQKENNQRMIDAYLNAAMQQGQQNINERMRMGRITVKRGGKLRNMQPSLRAVDNNVEVEGGELIITPNYVPQATDGGNIIPIGQTKDGNIISIAVGPSHDEKHMSVNGKKEGGVGMNVNEETAVLSRHTHNGFNPVEAVQQGMTPEDAFIIQENNKIMDKVNYKTPVGKRRLRYAGRTKAEIGDFYTKPIRENVYDTEGSFWQSPWGATTIAGIGNLLGWGATTLGNISAAKKQKAGVNAAADAMVDAYSRLKGVDLSELDDSYRHGIAALQDPTVSMGAERAAAERSLQRTLKGINRGTLSSAAAQNRGAVAQTNYNDVLGNIAGEEFKQRQQILAHNMDAINDMTKTNLSLDAQRANAKADLLKYNNDIYKESILGIGETESNRNKLLGQIRGQRNLANWSGLGNVFVNTGQTYQNQLNSYNKNLFGLLSAIAGATQEKSTKRALGVGSYFYPNLRNIYNNLV